MRATKSKQRKYFSAPSDCEKAPAELEWRSPGGSSFTGSSFTMQGLVAILAVLVGVFLVANARHVDTLRQAQPAGADATVGQLPDAALRGEPPPLFEDSADRMRFANARFRDAMLELAIARTTNAKRKCTLEAERHGKFSELWCAGTSYGR